MTWPVVILVILGLLVRYGMRNRGAPVRPLENAPLSEGVFDLVRIVDGDTLIVREPLGAQPDRSSAEDRRVRLLGIDCPESVKPDHPVEPWGPEASEFARQFVSGGRVELRLDDRRVDQYGRYLAYVYVGEQMLNEELVRAGLARVSIYPGDSESMARRLRRAEEEARAAARGIWSGDDRSS
jgi:micrococcal nuclease